MRVFIVTVYVRDAWYNVHIQRKLLIQFLVTLYLNDFSGTSSANYANTQNVKRAEETQG